MKRQKQLTGQQSVPVSYHIKELRNRLFWVLGVFMVGGTIGYTYQIAIINFLNQYMQGSLYYTSPAGNFNFIMKVSVLAGVLFAIPVIVYQAIKFTQPALKVRHQYRRTWMVSVLALGLALVGMAFAMWIIVPMSLHFFAGFNINGVKPLISADEYLNYVMKALLWFAVLFQIPLIMMFINRITPLKPRKLLKYEKFVIVAALVIALVLPFTYDPITQFVIAVPIVMLYNLSILLIWLSNRAKTKQAYKQQMAEQAYCANKTGSQTSKTPQATTPLVQRPKQQLQPGLNAAPAVKEVSAKRSIGRVNKTRVISDFGFNPQPAQVNKQVQTATKMSNTQPQKPETYQSPRGLSMDMILPIS